VTSLLFRLAVAISPGPSPLKSATAIDRGFLPVPIEKLDPSRVPWTLANATEQRV